jgi:hypothetical protein
LVSELHAGNARDLAPSLGAQGIRFVLLRRDMEAIIPNGPTFRTIPPVQLAEMLSADPDVHLVRSIGQLDLYAIAPGLVRAHVFVVGGSGTKLRSGVDVAGLAADDRSGTVSVPARWSACGDVTTSDSRARILAISRDRDGYTVRVASGAGASLLVLNEPYDAGWSASLEDGGGRLPRACDGVGPSHVMAAGFANAWWLQGTDVVTVHLTYRPQRIMDVANAISILGTAVLAILLIGGAVIYRFASTRPTSFGD